MDEVINQTFDDAKNKARKAIDETHKGAPDQLRIGGHPEDIAVNQVNKIYILSPEIGIVTVLDSKSGTIKNIPVGEGATYCSPYCMGVDPADNKIYVANALSDTVSVINGNNDTVKGKLNEDHRQMLKDKISEYYGSVKGSESGA
jgi:YVTN family beta-propeller protein